MSYDGLKVEVNGIEDWNGDVLTFLKVQLTVRMARRPRASYKATPKSGKLYWLGYSNNPQTGLEERSDFFLIRIPRWFRHAQEFYFMTWRTDRKSGHESRMMRILYSHLPEDMNTDPLGRNPLVRK